MSQRLSPLSGQPAPVAGMETGRGIHAIVVFYASDRYGSEYRAGLEFIDLARQAGFNAVVIADLHHNLNEAELAERFPGMAVVVVPSIVRRQESLYRYNDVVPQLVWHRRAAALIRQRFGQVNELWLQNGALPWLPVDSYLPIVRDRLIWGPVGGGGAARPGYLKGARIAARLREGLRGTIEHLALKRQVKQLNKFQAGGKRLAVMARTYAIASQLESDGLRNHILVVPEIVIPIRGKQITKPAAMTPRFVWVGQNVPRKNLAMAMMLFGRFRRHFPDATLDIYGSDDQRFAGEGVTLHGWVSRVPWEDYSAGGILLLTSFREGLPSVVLEALEHGLACVSTDVGSVRTLEGAPLYLIPMAEYPQVSEPVLEEIIAFVAAQLERTAFDLERIDHGPAIRRFVQGEAAF
jgi:glycosyltransferase involved in cell wall biosynthesis